MSTNGASTATSGSQRLTKKDFQSDQEVRWCPGCGDYAILAAVQGVFPTLGIAREKFVVVSGIGCSSRFPYYMNTFGFHTIHGRAPTVASGIKIADPSLSVWVVTGDGDGLSIGAGHFVHALRRNVGLKVLMFNNRIYGLTKGQYSPTSEVGKRTKSTPFGSVDHPINPLRIALGAEASFVANAVDRYPKELQATLKEAAEHEGGAFVHIYQNCNIFNDHAFEHFTERALRDETNLFLEPGKPMLFGKDKDKGLRFSAGGFEVVRLGSETGLSEADVAVHDPTNLMHAFALAMLPEPPHGVVPLGTIYKKPRETFESATSLQVEAAKASKGEGDLASLLNAGDTWEVKA